MSFEYIYRGRVAWVDTDAGRRIHPTAALRYAELAETEALRVAGIEAPENYPRRSVDAEFHEPLGFNDEFEVTLRPQRVGRTSITWIWEITREGELCVEGRHTVVHVDRNGRAAPLPADVRSTLGA